MIRNKEEALDLVKRCGIKISNHKQVIVTANRSIYLDSPVDPNESSELFVLKGAEVKTEEPKEETKTKPSKKVKDGTSDNII